MQFGIRMAPTHDAIPIVELGRAVEERGFESLFLPEHTHIPTDARAPTGGPPAEIPREYKHTLDPFVALAAIAAVTTRLKLGTGVCLVVERDPIDLAKQVATLDLLSQGRFLFGIGGGWNLAEMRNHGVDPDNRWRIVREKIRAMQQIWTQDAAEYHGTYVDFAPIWQWPKPAQRPYPPIIVGGDAPGTLKRVVDYGDEWMPITRTGAGLAEKIALLNRQAAEQGRGPIPVTAYWAGTEPETIARYRAAGVSRCVFTVPAAGRADVLPLLDRLAQQITAYA